MPWFFTTRIAVVSSAPSAASVGGERTRLAAPANESVVKKRRRVCIIAIGYLPFWRSRLQLALELVQKAPIRAVGDYLLRARLDEADFVKPQGIIADRVLGIVFAPFVVRNLVQRLQGIIITRCESAIDEPLRGAGRVGGAEIVGLEKRAQHAFGRN